MRNRKEVLRDLQTGALQGYRDPLSFPDAPEKKQKRSKCLGGTDAINFSITASPGSVDRVMAAVHPSCGLSSGRGARELKPTLLAVDRESSRCKPIV